MNWKPEQQTYDRALHENGLLDSEIEQLRENAEEAAEILDNLIASIKAHGHYSVDSTLLFLSQARQCLQVPND